MKLFFRFFLPIALVLVVSLGIANTVFTRSQMAFIAEESDERLQKNIRMVSASLNTFLLSSKALAEVSAGDEDLEAFMAEYSLDDQKTIEEIFAKLVSIRASSPVMDNVLLVPDTSLMEIDARRLSWGDPHDMTEGEEPVIPYFENHPNEAFMLRKPLLLKRAGGIILIEVATRIERDGALVGALILSYDMSRLMSELVYRYIEDEDVSVLVVDRLGNIYGTLDREQAYSDHYNLANTDSSFFEKLTTDGSGAERQVFMGEMSMVAYDYFEPLDSYIIAYKGTEDFLTAQARTMRNAAMLSAIVLILSGMATFLFIKGLIRPIDRLVVLADRVAMGNFDIGGDEVDEAREGEINRLRFTFNMMASNLKAMYDSNEVIQKRLHGKNQRLEVSEADLSNKVAEIQAQNDYISYLADHDSLTDLPNRRHIFETLDRMVEDQSGAVLLIDLDDFKSVNDSMGHVFGDKLLSAVAAELKAIQGEDTYVARLGGDEFILAVTDKDEIQSTLKRLRNISQKVYYIEEVPIETDFSIGIARFPEDSLDVEDLIAYADIAMYSVKGSGKNNHQFFNLSMEKRLIERERIEAAVKTALEVDGFMLVYQPQVDIRTGEIVAYEALLRLRSMEFMPDRFIPVAEDSRQIVKIGRWVMKAAIMDIARWQKEGLSVKPVSINFSAHQLYDLDFPDLLDGWLKNYGVLPEMIEIEVTESIYIENVRMTENYLRRISDMGIRIAIDDFGTGYSSLNYLTYIPLSKLKLDRSLSDKFLGEDSGSVISSIISLAHSLGLTVVAEGIEDMASVRRLLAADCDLIQGYCFSRPLPIENMPESLDKHYDIAVSTD